MTKGAWIAIGGLVAVALVYEYSNSLGVDDDDLVDDGDDGSGASSSTSSSSGASSSGTGIAGMIGRAIASFENVAARHNNPGALGTWQNGSFVPNNYDTPEQGTAAMLANITRYLVKEPGITVSQFVSKWESGNENPSSISASLMNYIQHVADALHLGPNDPIANAAGAGDGDGGDDDSTEDDDGGDDSW